MAASACSLRSLCSFRWHRRCFERHPFHAGSCRQRSRSAPRPSPCRRCRGLQRFRTRSQCHSSAQRHSRRLVWESLHPSSCWRSVCGGGGYAAARGGGEGYGAPAGAVADAAEEDPVVRELAPTAREFDPAEIHRGQHSATTPPVARALLPLVVVMSVNLLMSLIVLPRLDFSFLAEERWGSTSLAAVAGVWAVVLALACAIAGLIALHYRYFPSLRASMDAGANASVLPAFSVASLVGFGAVVAALPPFAAVRDWVLSIEGGPLVSLAVATNVLAALTGSASGGLT